MLQEIRRRVRGRAGWGWGEVSSSQTPQSWPCCVTWGSLLHPLQP